MARQTRPDRGFRAAVEAAVSALARGEVVSYGEIAEQAGFPGAARAVGGILRGVPSGMPWWRVVAADGHLISPAATEQAARLRAEGIRVVNGRVRLGPAAGPRTRGVGQHR